MQNAVIHYDVLLNCFYRHCVSRLQQHCSCHTADVSHGDNTNNKQNVCYRQKSLFTPCSVIGISAAMQTPTTSKDFFLN